jgi:arsenite methyltransferase
MPSKTAAAPAPTTADYGIDAPKRFRSMIWRGSTVFLLGFGFLIMNRGDAASGGVPLFIALTIIAIGFFAAAALMRWSSRVGKLRYRDEMLDAIPWRGDEKVLDVGCGSGLMLIGAAKRLKTGKATGLDPWVKEDLTGNTPENAMANARAEGVAERVRVENGDARRLPYSANLYDVVLSSAALHGLPESEDRDKAVLEMLRVTKSGGHLAILDILHTGDYMRVLSANGAEIVRKSGLSFLWCMPTRWFVARKKV